MTCDPNKSIKPDNIDEDEEIDALLGPPVISKSILNSPAKQSEKDTSTSDTSSVKFSSIESSLKIFPNFFSTSLTSNTPKVLQTSTLFGSNTPFSMKYQNSLTKSESKSSFMESLETKKPKDLSFKEGVIKAVEKEEQVVSLEKISNGEEDEENLLEEKIQTYILDIDCKKPEYKDFGSGILKINRHKISLYFIFFFLHTFMLNAVRILQ